MVCDVLVQVPDPLSRRIYRVPPSYAEWLETVGLPPRILDGSDSAGETVNSLQAVERLSNEAASTVERLILAGMPEEDALRMLPHEVYVALKEKEETEVRRHRGRMKKRKPTKMTAGRRKK